MMLVRPSNSLKGQLERLVLFSEFPSKQGVGIKIIWLMICAYVIKFQLQALKGGQLPSE